MFTGDQLQGLGEAELRALAQSLLKETNDRDAVIAGQDAEIAQRLARSARDIGVLLPHRWNCLAENAIRKPTRSRVSSLCRSSTLTSRCVLNSSTASAIALSRHRFNVRNSSTANEASSSNAKSVMDLMD